MSITLPQLRCLTQAPGPIDRDLAKALAQLPAGLDPVPTLNIRPFEQKITGGDLYRAQAPKLTATRSGRSDGSRLFVKRRSEHHRQSATHFAKYPWTPEKAAYALDLRNKGLQTSAIVREMTMRWPGTVALTRNMVVAKLNRMSRLAKTQATPYTGDTSSQGSGYV